MTTKWPLFVVITLALILGDRAPRVTELEASGSLNERPVNLSFRLKPRMTLHYVETSNWAFAGDDRRRDLRQTYRVQEWDDETIVVHVVRDGRIVGRVELSKNLTISPYEAERAASAFGPTVPVSVKNILSRWSSFAGSWAPGDARTHSEREDHVVFALDTRVKRTYRGVRHDGRRTVAEFSEEGEAKVTSPTGEMKGTLSHAGKSIVDVSTGMVLKSDARVSGLLFRSGQPVGTVNTTTLELDFAESRGLN